MPTYKFARFSQKLHEIKKILVRGEEGGVDPPLYNTSGLQLNFIRSSLDIYLFRCEENVGLDRWFSRILHELESCPDQQFPIL